MDVLAVRDAVRAAAAHVRRGGGPMFLELRTYRFRAHSMFDAELYRTKAEVQAWKERCPIAAFEREIAAAGLAVDVAAIEQAVADEVADALAFAEAGTPEPVADLLKDVTA